MKNLVLFLLCSFLVLLTANADECKLDLQKTVVKGEAEVPTWNPVKKKTMLMRVDYTQFTSPFPDFVQFHIKTSGGCDKVDIKSVKVYRQIGPQDWVDNKKYSAHEDDHSSHKKPESILKWEKKAFKSFSPKVEKAGKYLILRQIPIEEPLEEHKDKEHIWALRFEVEYKGPKGSIKTSDLTLEAPLIH